jgi:hypothetical protein
MIEHARRAAPDRQAEKATKFGTTFSWLFSLLPIAHHAGSGASRCPADLPDFANAHSQINLALHCSPLNLGNSGQTKEPATESTQPYSFLIGCLSSTTSRPEISLGREGRLGASQICHLLVSKETWGTAGICGDLTVVTRRAVEVLL